MRPEYDFSGGVRGKHAQEYRRGHTVTIHRKDGSTVVERHGHPLQGDASPGRNAGPTPTSCTPSEYTQPRGRAWITNEHGKCWKPSNAKESGT
jgi:hypothetical protein